MKKLLIVPLEFIIGGEGKHVLLHPSKTANIFKYLDIIDLLSSLAHTSTYKLSTRFATSQKITSMRMFQSVSFGSLAHVESSMINRFGALPSFITTHIYFSRLSQLYASYLWKSPKSAAEDGTPLCSNLHALEESTWNTWALFNLAEERLWGPEEQPSHTQAFTREKGPRALSRFKAREWRTTATTAGKDLTEHEGMAFLSKD